MTDVELIKKYVDKEHQDEALKKLELGIPVQYIIGNVDFYNNKIIVNENVLIPRFETEYLVDKVIKIFKNKFNKKLEILDIGTGSGCISIALKKELDCNVEAIDISHKALEVAKLNAKKNNVDINFLECDIHNYESSKKFDVIISNPPYVPFNGNVDEKIKYEPANAIFAENDGLYFYNIILQKIKGNLNDKYLIAFEIGDQQGQKISSSAKEYFPEASIVVEKDYNGYQRYLYITNF